jgi:hypothetical protein
MKSFRFHSNLLAAALLALLFTCGASAQATRTWVSGVGDDANPCSRTAPCKTFAGAISKTATAGEIDCLDPGGFGAVTITKSLTIDCRETLGGVLVSGTNGIVVNDGTYAASVTLRGLDIDGTGTGLSGISFVAGKVLHVEDVKIYGFTTSCIDVNAGGGIQFTVDNATLSECGTAGISAVTSGANQIWGNINNVKILDTPDGLNAQNGSRLVVRGSNFFATTVAVNQPGVGGSGSVVTVTASTLSHNGTVFQSSSGGSIIASANDCFNNGLIFNPNGGAIYTFGDNTQANSGLGVANGGTLSKI